MAAYHSAVENTRLMEDLKHASQKYVNLALFQHLNGHINYLDVLDAQRSYFNAERDHSNAIRDQHLALIELYKALGGGWKQRLNDQK
jgi:multidrug efflux system outer membrane protein